jgi:transposase-like protein
MERKLKNRRMFTPEFKVKVAAQAASGSRTLADLSREHNVKDSVIAKWRDQLLERSGLIFGAGHSEKEKIEALEQEIGRQHMEIEILKKASKRLP